jgi:mono/diheme cytochrome c family protein
MLALVSVIAAIPASCPAAGENIQPATAALLETHCFACHGKDGKVKGDFDLRGLKTASDLLSRPELLQRMRDAVLDGEMPPPKAPQLPPPERDALLAGIGHLLETSLQTHSASPRTPVRRMNRLQYANAVNDLLGLKVELFVLPECILRDLSGYFQPETGRMPEQVEVGNRILGKGQLIAPRLEGVSPFPQDLRAANGYDNRADLLTLSPLLMESFLELSRSIFASSNLDARTCGKWRPYFEPPPTSVPVDAALEARLREFLTRAFRRTVDEGTLERYTAAARSHLQSGVDFTGAMKAAASAALASPRFLYLYDDATTGARPEKVDPFELAARLSFFLWSSIPDDELLALAACGRLSDPTVLAEQADRLMNDRRMKRFCDAFASQWLKIENLVACEPDMGRFSDFYQFGIVSHAKFGSVHMMLEPLLLFETVFVENRPVTDFIHSDFTYRSEQLAQFIRREKRFSPAKDGANWSETCVFSRQPVTSKREGGLITTSAVMTMTSNATTPKPISRGKWIVETLFNDPPPPPPGKVPDIAEAVTDKAKEKQMTLRQKFSLHSTEANCAACHAKIDPFGFALENYDAVGRWRDRDDNGHELDPSGKLFNRQEFKTIEQFKDALLSEKARFARGLAGHLLKYALGREVTSFDRPALDQIVATSAADGYRLRGMMRQVILSEPFSMKFNPPEDGASSQPSAPLKP